MSVFHKGLTALNMSHTVLRLVLRGGANALALAVVIMIATAIATMCNLDNYQLLPTLKQVLLTWPFSRARCMWDK